MRTLIDRSGLGWTVRLEEPASVGQATAGAHGSNRLTFECENGERRHLAPAPQEWDRCSETRLALMLAMARAEPPAERDAPEDRREAPPAGSTPAGPARARILLAEDDEALQRALERFLTREGYAVRTADDVAGALAIAREWCPDLVLTDVTLKVGTGWELVAALRAEAGTRACRIVTISGYGPETYAAEPMLREVEAYLRKPFDLEYLHGVLLGVLAGGGVADRRVRGG